MKRPHGLALLLVLVAGRASAGAPEPGLIHAIESDPSFKVRMQAVRVLTDRLVKTKLPPPIEAISAMAKAAQSDESYLVRGLAAFSLGRLKDPRGQDAVRVASKDKEAFVRAQAEQALAAFAEGGGPAVGIQGAAPLLLLATEDTPGVTPPAAILERLKTQLERRLHQEAGPSFDFDPAKKGRGFKLRGSVAEWRIEDAGTGSMRVTAVVRVAIVTWPEGNLRHIVTARASAAAKAAPGPALERLSGLVLDAAADKAVKDAMAEIRRG